MIDDNSLISKLSPTYLCNTERISKEGDFDSLRLDPEEISFVKFSRRNSLGSYSVRARYSQ